MMRPACTLCALLLASASTAWAALAPGPVAPPSNATPPSAGHAGASTNPGRARRAIALLESARRRLADGRPEQRQFAREELQEAKALDPDNLDIAVLLASACLHGDLVREARRIASEVVARDPSNSGAWQVLGLSWRREWLVNADEGFRDRAILYLARSLRAAPAEFEGWAALIPLLVDEGAIAEASDAAAMALQLSPARPEAALMAAAMAQRTGDLDRAERLFRDAIPRLPAALRERFEDLSPLLPPWAIERYTPLGAEARTRYAARYWAENDPDPASAANEARLEFEARVTQACMLYGPARDGFWDLRAQYYVRFGAPSRVEFDPASLSENRLHGLVWYYDDLGMRLWMSTRAAATTWFGYAAPLSGGTSFVAAYPESLARHPDLAPTQGGWTVFHALPANMRPLDLHCTLARFKRGGDARLLAQAEVPGEPDREFMAEWAVLDSGLAEVARASVPMAVSACRPGDARAASFATTLPPGAYRVGIHVDDGRGHRGVFRRGVAMAANDGHLALSDLVVTCGIPETAIRPGEGLRLEPETGLFPLTDDRLRVYFEIYALEPGRQGDAQFEYVCTVRPAVRDRRGWLSRLISRPLEAATIEMTRREVTHGEQRRQFITVPVEALPAGKYEIEVKVLDIGSGEESKAVARFERETRERSVPATP